jgi:hypothetical protein
MYPLLVGKGEDFGVALSRLADDLQSSREYPIINLLDGT